MPSVPSITTLLKAANRGESAARNELWSLIYDELHRLAKAQLVHEAPGRTLQPTSLVHEAYLRLIGTADIEWSNRRHFFGAAARAMRQIRIDDARRRKRLKRGGGQERQRVSEVPGVLDQDPVQLLAVDEALNKLEKDDARKAEVVMLRYFGDISEEETASILGVSRRTVQSDWRLARAWLHRELSKGDTSVDRDS